MEKDNQQLLPQDKFEQDKVPLAVPAEVQQPPLRCDGDNNNNNNNSNNSNNKSNNSNTISNMGNNNNNSNICNSNNNSSSNIDSNLSNYISNINNSNNSCNNRNNTSNRDNSGNNIDNIGNNSNINNSIHIGNSNNSNHIGNIGNNSNINNSIHIGNSNNTNNIGNIGNNSNINNSIHIGNSNNSNNIGNIGNNSNINNSNHIGNNINNTNHIGNINNSSNYIGNSNNSNNIDNIDNNSNINNSNHIGNNINNTNHIGNINNNNNIVNNRSNHNIGNINNNSYSIGHNNSNHISNNNSNIILRRNNNNNRNNNRNNYNRLYTVELGPTAAMLVHVSPEQQQQQQQQQQEDSSTPSSWRISTLLIHNGQHYRNVIRNFTPLSIFMQNFDQRLLNITRPVEFQRLPMLPLNVFHMVEFYCQQLITASHNLEEVFDQHSLLPAMVLTLRHTTNTLQTMLYQIEQSLFSTSRPQRVRDAMRALGSGHAVGMQADDDSDSDSNTESEGSGCEICLHRQASSCLDGALLRHLHCDIESTSSSESESERRTNLAFLTRDFDENPQQFWSMTSSEDENENEEELGDEESWDSWQSDFEDDDDSFDAYMVRLLRGNAHGHWTARQANSEWVAPAQQTDGLEWDVGSCDSNDEYEEICSIITDSSEEDLDAWQYNEDRSFETELSRPIRRLIGEIPAQTAQQERHSWLHFVQLCEFRSEIERACNALDREPLHSLSYRRSDRLRRDQTPPPPPAEVQHVERPQSRHIWDHGYAISPNAQMNCLRQTIRAMIVANQQRLQGTNSESDSEIDSEYNPRDDNDNENDNENEETETEFEMNDQEHEHERRTIYSDMEVDIDLEVGLDMNAQLDQIEPLATFLQQTDELIAKLMSGLKG